MPPSRARPGRQSACEEQPDPLVGEAGRGPDPAERHQLARADARFLLAFARGADLGSFARVELAGGDLEQPVATGRVPILAHQQHLAVVGHRHHRGGAGVADQLERRTPSRRQLDLLEAQVEHLAAVDRRRPQDARFAVGTGDSLAHAAILPRRGR